MPFQLNPSKIPIWRNESDLRLGLSGESQILGDVTNAQERLINLLFQGIPEEQLSLVGGSVGLSDAETSELVAKLKPSLLNSNHDAASGKALDVRFAEIIRIGFETNDAPEGVLAKRAETVIQIQQLNRTGLLIIRALSEAGFCIFETIDYETVKRQDLGELSYQPSQLGTSRLAAAREVLASHYSKSALKHCETRSRKGVQLVVLSEMHQLNPRTYRGLSQPHLAIEYGIETLRVSPILIPGLTPCLGCRDLWEAENNADWASTSIQLAARNDYLDDGVALLLATAIAAKSICQFVSDTSNAGIEGFSVSLRNRSVSRSSWQLHPGCPCRARN